MAGPGATIRVDGFRGGKLPPKSQIRSIRFSSGMFAAENHAGGITFVDIATQPGLGPLRGGLDFTFRDDALNAATRFSRRKGPRADAAGTRSTLSGTLLKDRTSFSLSAGGASLYDSANVSRAADGSRARRSRRPPHDRINFNGRLDHALTKSHTLRADYQQNVDDQRESRRRQLRSAGRAYSRTADDERMLRSPRADRWGRRWFGEIAAATALALELICVVGRTADDQRPRRLHRRRRAAGRRPRDTRIEWATNVD